MTARPSSSIVPEIDAEFHTVEWVRGVRNQMYAATATLSAEELIRFVHQAADSREADTDKAHSDARTA